MEYIFDMVIEQIKNPENDTKNKLIMAIRELALNYDKRINPLKEEDMFVIPNTKEWGNRIVLTKDELEYVFKKVTLYDLSECVFEHGEPEDEPMWVNAVLNGRVIDSITWDGNIFSIMNNNEDFDFSPLCPMISGYKALHEYSINKNRA